LIFSKVDQDITPCKYKYKSIIKKPLGSANGGSILHLASPSPIKNWNSSTATHPSDPGWPFVALICNCKEKQFQPLKSSKRIKQKNAKPT
jgi:hypothetical protein